MYDSNAPRTVDSIDGRSLVEVAVIAIGTSALIVAAALVAFAAAATAGNDSATAFVVALAVGGGTIAIGIAAARWTGDRLSRAIEQ